MLSSKIKVTPSEGDPEYVEESEDDPVFNPERRSKREQDVHEGEGQGSSSEELEDYADSDSGNDGGEDGKNGTDGDRPEMTAQDVSRYATINFSWIAILFSISPFSPIIYIFLAKFCFFFFAQGYK